MTSKSIHAKKLFLNHVLVDWNSHVAILRAIERFNRENPEQRWLCVEIKSASECLIRHQLKALERMVKPHINELDDYLVRHSLFGNVYYSPYDAFTLTSKNCLLVFIYSGERPSRLRVMTTPDLLPTSSEAHQELKLLMTRIARHASRTINLGSEVH